MSGEPRAEYETRIPRRWAWATFAVLAGGWFYLVVIVP